MPPGPSGLSRYYVKIFPLTNIYLIMGWESDKASVAGLESAFFAASALSLAFSMADLAILKVKKG